ncbi:MAG: flagellar basal body-associated FliL family protein [Myxococcaceae bacterium]|nr:flagellar basal body-associated FliL family protein [Myxococcaceae bacterium]
MAALVAPPAKSKIVPILVGVNTLMMAGVLAVVLMKSGHSEAQPAPKKAAAAEAGEGHDAEAEEPAEEEGHDEKGKKPLAGPTVKLDDFVVRLRNPEADRFARVSFEVEVGTERDKERLMASMARVRDGFIGELTDRTVEELRGTDGLTTIKTNLTHKLKELVPGCRVRGLYVTDFIVQ